MDVLRFILILFASALMSNVPDVNGSSYGDLKSLTETMLNSSRYRTDSKPLLNQSRAIQVSPFFKLVSIVEVNDVMESFVCNGFMAVVWNDEMLRWDPDLYGGIEVFHPSPQSIWRARMSIMNTLDERDPFGDDPSPVTVHSDGSVLWIPGGLFKTSCDLNLLTYPFDEQVCTIKVIPVSYELHELVYRDGSSELDFFTLNGEWDLQGTNITFSTLAVEDVIYSSFEVTFMLKRRPTYFVLNILLPVVLLSLLNMLVFIIPADSGEKVSYGITVVLAMSVFLSIVSSMLPRSSDVVPNVTIYLFILLVVSVLTVIDAIIIVFFSHLEEKQDKSVQISRQYSQATNKISLIRRALFSMRPTRKVTPPNSGSDRKSVMSLSPLEADEGQGQGSNYDQELHANGEKGKMEEDGKTKERPTRVNKYKVIGKYIDIVSLIVFLLTWFIVTLWYFTSVL